MRVGTRILAVVGVGFSGVVVGWLVGVWDLEFNFDVLAFDPYRVTGHTSWRRQAQYAPGCHVEDGAVPRAGYLSAHNHSFGEGPAPMGAGVVNRIECSGDVEKRDALRSNVHSFAFTRSDVAGFGDLHELGHGAHPLVSAYARFNSGSVEVGVSSLADAEGFGGLAKVRLLDPEHARSLPEETSLPF
jgi:hypothetical protein